MPEPRSTQSCGDLPLLPSDRLVAWRAQAEAFKRECEQELMDRRERERKILRARQPGRTELDATIEAVGEFVARVRRDLRAEFAEQLGQLRAELNVAKVHDPGQVINLPALPLRGKSDAA